MKHKGIIEFLPAVILGVITLFVVLALTTPVVNSTQLIVNQNGGAVNTSGASISLLQLLPLVLTVVPIAVVLGILILAFSYTRG